MYVLFTRKILKILLISSTLVMYFNLKIETIDADKQENSRINFIF